MLTENVIPPRPKSQPQPDPAGPDRRQPLPLNAQARMIARTVLTVALVTLALWVGSDFLQALGWAAILSITTWPLYSRFVAFFGRIRSPIIAPLLFTFIVGVLLLLPLVPGRRRFFLD